MATAKREKFTKTVTVEESGVTLRLSDDEAEFLASLLAKVGGSPEKSPRKYQRSISDALTDAGYDWGRSDSLMSGSILCAEYPAERAALKVGDQIRILQDYAEFASAVRTGDKLRVTNVSDRYVKVRDYRSTMGHYSFALTNEGTTWERV